MCGIIGYIGNRDCRDIILNGLKRLEYRGYDSSGVAFIDSGKLRIEKCKGKINDLIINLQGLNSFGKISIGHTRWATHGKPSDSNAHPHRSDNIALVHNGIIENYRELKEGLINRGVIFQTETDTEIIAKLISEKIKNKLNFEKAVLETLRILNGAFALTIINADEPDKIILAKKNCPLIIGVGDNENFVASDVAALIDCTNKFIFLDDNEVGIVSSRDIKIKKLFTNEYIEKEIKEIKIQASEALKEGFTHYMQKEIFEQPRAISDTISYLVSNDSKTTNLNSLETNGFFNNINKIIIIACGTSYYAGLVGKFIIEKLGNISCEVDLGSEFRYRNPVCDNKTLIISISQSGETADTLASIEEAKIKGCKILSICNVQNSSIARKSDYSLYTFAGVEIGVASTKAFTTQLVTLFLLGIYLGRISKNIKQDEEEKLISELVKIPAKINLILNKDAEIIKIAKKYFHKNNFLYLGRGVNYPIALEGALKLKEISYIHAEGYPAGEMKHGPIALIDEEMPVVIIAPKDKNYSKIISNLEEVRARDGTIITIAEDGDEDIKKISHETLYVPKTHDLFSPVLTVIPLQLLAYHIAVLKGTDVDQPRNLAKSVTVE
jgi:glucosamine--fructose-6-phosphate aminotransferase (isomerizing)